MRTQIFTTLITALLGHPHQQRRARPLDRYHEEAEILPVPPRRVGAVRHHHGQRRLNRHKSLPTHCRPRFSTTLITALLGHPHQQRRARPLDRHHEEAEILPVPPRRVGAVRHHRGQRRLNRHKRGHHSRRLRSLERAKTCRTWTPANEGEKPWRVHPERGLAVRATVNQERRPRLATTSLGPSDSSRPAAPIPTL